MAREFFEALGIAYRGPVDGHDLEALEEALRLVARRPGPTVLHVHTAKGRGYEPAELDEEKCLHDVGPFDPETGVLLAGAAGSLSHTEAFGSALLREAAAHPEIVAITAAMAGPTGLLAFRDRYPDRFFDVGIAEQHAVNTGCRHGHGGPAASRGHLLHLPQQGLGPGLLRRRVAPAACDLLPRPGRDHR